MIKTAMLLNILVETMIIFFRIFLMIRKFKRTAFTVYESIKVTTVTFEKKKAYLLKYIHFLKKQQQKNNLITPNF